MPQFVIGEFFRMNYLIVRLLQNALNRVDYYYQDDIPDQNAVQVKFSFEDNTVGEKKHYSLRVNIRDCGPILNRN